MKQLTANSWQRPLGRAVAKICWRMLGSKRTVCTLHWMQLFTASSLEKVSKQGGCKDTPAYVTDRSARCAPCAECNYSQLSRRQRLPSRKVPCLQLLQGLCCRKMPAYVMDPSVLHFEHHNLQLNAGKNLWIVRRVVRRQLSAAQCIVLFRLLERWS